MLNIFKFTCICLGNVMQHQLEYVELETHFNISCRKIGNTKSLLKSILLSHYQTLCHCLSERLMLVVMAEVVYPMARHTER